MANTDTLPDEAQTTEDLQQDSAVATVAAPAQKRRKVKRSVPAGQVHILATFNNTIVTVTDTKGNALTSSSAGACGFRGSKKSTAYAAQIASEKAANDAKQQFGMSKVDVIVKGIGQGRDSAIRALQNVDLFVTSIRDDSAAPHGGCRPRRARRT